MTKSRGIRKKHNIGDIIIRPDGTQWKVGEDRKWIYIKKPKGYFKKDQPKPQKPKPVFPSVNLPDHIKATAYPCYYISNDGIAYREPRPRDASGYHGEINQWGLIEMKTQLRGNPYNKSKMYEGLNIYFYDENGKNIGYTKKNIHQLVAEAWVPNPNNHSEILHIDENNRNNHYTNLKWGTHWENMSTAKDSCSIPKSYKITDTITGKVWKGINMATWVRENYDLIIPRVRSSKIKVKDINRGLSNARTKKSKIWGFIVEY